MTKKGIIQEIFSKARYADDPTSYQIFYRDFDKIRELSLLEFYQESNNFEIIPVTRIQLIKKNHKILFMKEKHG